MADVVPVYAMGFFHVSSGAIYYTIIYDYKELTREATRRILDPMQRQEEELYIAKRMQQLMDEERIVVNGHDTRCIVDYVRLEKRGPKNHSAIINTHIPYEPVPGKNVYENFYEPTEAPYSYTAYWIAPPRGRIVSVDSPGKVEYHAKNRITVIKVRKGTKLSGYEAVVFTLG